MSPRVRRPRFPAPLKTATDAVTLHPLIARLAAMDPPHVPAGATDIFSISDQTLADKLHFVNEIGFGNWGSVWLCRPREGNDKLSDAKVAVKLVHRNKTKTASARVQSLWNEMKIVRSFNDDPHPSIVPFYSFIITPSYALITMAHLPRLIPVELPETRAKPWLHSLLSGVDYLHRRGVVHNDIKPANILLSTTNVPTLVDFGFAEQYNPKSQRAFVSSVSYGTPEYLSPERARGLPHDTRKSDIWSLGVTFFELLVGRTPFEYEEGEQFSTKAELEAYWGRTIRGKWVGTWKMSKGVEKMLKRMLVPNADLRYTAREAASDEYWTQELPAREVAHRKSGSVVGRSKTGSPSVVDIISPWSTRVRSVRGKPKERKENVAPADTHHAHAHEEPGQDREFGRPPGFHSEARAESPRPGSAQAKVLAAKEQAKQKHAAAEPAVSVLAPALKPKPSLRPKPSNIPVLKRTESNSALHEVASKNTLRSSASRETSASHARSASISSLARKPSLVGSHMRSSSIASLTRSVSVASNTRRESMAVFKKPPPTPIKEAPEVASPSSSVHKENVGMPKARGGARGTPPRTRADTGKSRRPLGPRVPSSPDTPAMRAALNAARVSGERSRRHKDHKENGAAEKENSTNTTPDKERKRKTPGVKRDADGRVKGREERPRRALAQIGAGDEERSHTQSASQSRGSTNPNVSVSDSVRSRIAEWANARERLREIALETEIESEIEFRKETDVENTVEKPLPQVTQVAEGKDEQLRRERDRERQTRLAAFLNAPKAQKDNVPQDVHSGESSFLKLEESLPRIRSQSPPSGLGHNLRTSIGHIARSYKSSLGQIGQIGKKSSPRLSVATNDDEDWGEAVMRYATTVTGGSQETRVEPQPAVEQEDRMAAWMRNVEKVVEDARLNFASTSSQLPPALPVSPPSRLLSSSQTRSNRSSRLPRKLLAANEIFYEDGSPNTSMFLSSPTSPISTTFPTIPSETPEHSAMIEESSIQFAANSTASPPRARRYTISTRSPKPSGVTRSPGIEIEIESPSKRRERWRSQGDLLQQAITPKERLTLELDQAPPCAGKQSLPLSSILDRKAFIAEPRTPGAQDTFTPDTSFFSHDLNSLTASPYHVHPYPATRPVSQAPIPDTPARKQLESVYDRFLMATSGVRRVGQGYQSSNAGRGPVSSQLAVAAPPRRNAKLFNSTRRPMPPPVSSADYLKAVSVDELGCLSRSPGAPAPDAQENRHTFAVVGRALKAVVNGKTVSRRLSRIE